MQKIEVLPPGPAPIRRANSSGRERGRAPRRVTWVVACSVLGVAIGAGAGIGTLMFGDSGMPPAPGRPLAGVTVPVLEPRREVRAVYPHSVVPGGVDGADEAMAAADRDPVVAGHYRDVQLSALRPTLADAPRAVHVSYRLGDRIYWTKRKVALQPGELLLTDGLRTIRARCGNCVSDTARGPVSDQEPAPEVFDQPVPTAGTTRGGGIAPMRAYDFFASAGLMPPALSSGASGGTPSFGGVGVPGFGGGATGGFPGGLPDGVATGRNGTPGDTTAANRPSGTDSPRGGTLPPFDSLPPTPGEGIFEPPPGGGSPPGLGGGPFGPPAGGGTTPPPSGGGAPPTPGGNAFEPPPPGGGTSQPPGGGTPPSSGGGIPGPPPSGGGTPPPLGGGLFGPPPGGGTPPTPGGGTLIPPTAPDDDDDGGTTDSPAQVPEPHALLLLMGGLSALAVRRLRCR